MPLRVATVLLCRKLLTDLPLEEIILVPDIVHPLSVSTRSTGKQSLILELRLVWLVNAFIKKKKVQVWKLVRGHSDFWQGLFNI